MPSGDLQSSLPKNIGSSLNTMKRRNTIMLPMIVIDEAEDVPFEETVAKMIGKGQKFNTEFRRKPLSASSILGEGERRKR